MKIIKGYKTELNPNNKQKTVLNKHIGTARFAYNWALEKKTKAFIAKERIPNSVDLHKELNKLKKTELPWMYEVSKCAPQEALRNCDVAFDNFFRKCKQKIKGNKGYPKFKSKKQGVGSFRLTGIIKVNSKFIQLPRLGKLRLKEMSYLPANAKILSATVSQKAGKWFVSLQVEECVNKFIGKKESTIGIDLGVKKLAISSDGQFFDYPHSLKKISIKLKKLYKQLSKKQKGGNNRRKAYTKLAKLYYKMSNIRKDALHKITTKLTKAKSRIVIEDLNVSGLMKNKNVSFAIQNASFYEFSRQLKYKGELYGCEITIADRFFPSSKLCSNCGHKKCDLSLKDRIYICENCHVSLNRDLNAAINLSKIPSVRREYKPLENEALTQNCLSETFFVELGSECELCKIS